MLPTVKVYNTRGKALILTSEFIKYASRVGCHVERIALKSLRNGETPGHTIPISSKCVYTRLRPKRQMFKVSIKHRQIGCCLFNTKNWKIILRYRRAARNRRAYNAARKSMRG